MFVQRLFFTTVYLFTIIFGLKSQNTLGTLRNDPGTYDGYTLFGSVGGFKHYLIDNCGSVVKDWTSNFPPGLAAYLDADGSLYRSCRILNQSMSMGGLGGRIERYDWSGNLLWFYRISGPDSTSHHDFHVLPNGNILVLVVYLRPISSLVPWGRNPSLTADTMIFSESVLELRPIGQNSAQIVWRWNALDHTIQDFDSTKTRYGQVADHPEKMNINYIGSSNNRDWMHINSIDYREDLDQIVLSFRHTNEIWVIDHSTTTQEASGSSGGRYGKGGDILYRWGNPSVYNRGTVADQKLFGAHDAHWVASGNPGAGNFLIFNNGDLTGTSSVLEWQSPADAQGFYPGLLPNEQFGPDSILWSYTNNSTLFYANRLSSAQRLPNGNTLICSGPNGYFLEVDTNGQIFWEYRNPATGTGILTQGQVVNLGINSVFAINRYSPNDSAFIGRTLIAGAPVELNPDQSNCQLTTNLDYYQPTAVKIYPNPAGTFFQLDEIPEGNLVQIFNLQGQLIQQVETKGNNNQIDCSTWPAGIYLISIQNGIQTLKIVKE